MTEQKPDLRALREGLPEGPWTAEDFRGTYLDCFRVEAPSGEVIALCAEVDGERYARAIAAIPSMLEEIERLREERDTTATDLFDSREDLRALNAEMREEFERTIARLERCMLAAGTDKEFVDVALEKPRAILAKTESP